MSHLLPLRWLSFYTLCITEAGTIVSWKLTSLRNSFHKMLHHSLLTQFSHPQFCKEYISEIDRIVHWAIWHSAIFAKCLNRLIMNISQSTHFWNLKFRFFYFSPFVLIPFSSSAVFTKSPPKLQAPNSGDFLKAPK